jgi:hypothetical protein
MYIQQLCQSRISTVDHALSLVAPAMTQFQVKVKVKVKVTLRLTISQSVYLSWCRAPAGAHDQMFLLV